MPALSGRHSYLVSCRGKRWSLQRISTVWCRWCRNTQARASTLMPRSARTTTAICGPTSLMATLEWGSPKLYHICFYFCLQCLNHSHTYTAPKVGGQVGQSCHRHPQPSPSARVGADIGAQGAWGEPWGHCPGPPGLGSPQHPDTAKLCQDFKTDVTGGLEKKKKKRFLGHFRYNTRRAAHRLEEWDILLLRENWCKQNYYMIGKVKKKIALYSLDKAKENMVSKERGAVGTKSYLPHWEENVLQCAGEVPGLRSQLCP